jgi:uncharacterized protein (TIGR00661 family)
MTRIVYGVSGEGSGHSSRARVVLEHLVARGHEVLVATYDRGVDALGGDFDVCEVEGLHIASEDNQVSIARTFLENFQKLPEGFRAARAFRQRWKELSPEVAITDFEPLTAHLADHYGVPLVSIDNQHRMRSMHYPCPAHLKKDSLVTETVIRMMVPHPDAKLVTTFWFGEVTDDRTFLFPPLLRSAVRALTPTDGDHVLVYFTKGFETMVERLRCFPRERFLVYGQGREGKDANLEFRAPSRDGFLADLASSKAVISTAGFTLLSECLHLGKPLLALPMEGQFEQELNALLLEDTGCGRNGRDVDDDAVAAFLYRLPEHRAALAARERTDDSALLAKVDELVADGGAGVAALRAQG